MAIKSFSEFQKETKFLSVSQRLARAYDFLEYLTIERGSVTSTSTDGISVTRDIGKVESLIEILKKRAAEEMSGGWITQMRIPR